MVKEKGRPPCFLFDSGAWNGSPTIRGMDGEQIGWYTQLLADAWESTQTPQATLPNDDIVLKSRSRFDKSKKKADDQLKQIKAALVSVLSVVEQPLTPDKAIALVSTVIAQLQHTQDEEFEERWATVKAQFKTVPQAQHLVHNPRQITELRRWMDALDKKRRAGQLSAEQRWGTAQTQGNKELLEEGMVEPHPMMDNSAMGVLPENPVLGSSAMRNNSNIQNSTSNNDVLQKFNSVTEISTIQSTEKKEQKRLLPKKPETIFDEKKFRITEGMSAHLSQKYPKFVSGDWDYLVEKFKDVYYQKRYTSWSRTFYNFVRNQIVLYSYTPGAFAALEAQGQSQPRNSTQERHAQAEREADELSRRYLQGSGASSDSEDSDALPLAPGDIR